MVRDFPYVRLASWRRWDGAIEVSRWKERREAKDDHAHAKADGNPARLVRAGSAGAARGAACHSDRKRRLLCRTLAEPAAQEQALGGPTPLVGRRSLASFRGRVHASQLIV